MKKHYLLLHMLLLLCTASSVRAQLSLSGQIRTRTEFRDGQGTPAAADAPPAIFTSQRTRLNAGYTGPRFTTWVALQDVRVWGQDASTVNRTTSGTYDGLMLHEAWAEISLLDTANVNRTLSLKIGRQELLYDDSRLLGNLDWLQQARRHDAALVKYDNRGWTAHVGAAFNQNAERKSGTAYNGMPMGYPPGTGGIGAMYKSMQFLYAGRKLPFGAASILAFKDDFSRYSFAAEDSLQTTPIYSNKVWSRYTVGGNIFGTINKRLSFALSAFYQGGKYREGTDLNEYLLSASALWALTPAFSFGPGVDVTSGNNGTDASKKFKRFDPLYGTPHKFWGYMDYFYVADGFGPSGLADYYLKTKFKAMGNLMITADLHHFMLPQAIPSETGVEMDKSLGTEADIVLNYSLTKIVNIETGVSAMFSTPTLTSAGAKNVRNAERVSTWAYLMISIKPELLTINQNK